MKTERCYGDGKARRFARGVPPHHLRRRHRLPPVLAGRFVTGGPREWAESRPHPQRILTGQHLEDGLAKMITAVVTARGRVCACCVHRRTCRAVFSARVGKGELSGLLTALKAVPRGELRAQQGTLQSLPFLNSKA